jgi:hypothetical protein
VPPAPAATDRAATPPRAKRPPRSDGSSSPTPTGRTLDPAVRPAPALGGAPAPTSPRADRPEREDGAAAIDWLLKQ